MSSNIKTDKAEVWITDTDSQSLLGTGTIKGNGLEQTPYYGDIDAIIESIAANYVLRFTSGTFYMNGYQEASGDASNIKDGQKWVGAGMFQTTLKYGGTDPNTNGVVMVNALAGTDDVEICDMTIDCDGDDSDTFKRMQVGFKGNNSVIRRVRAINSCGTFPGEESFGLLVGNPGTTGNTIEGCICTDFYGDYTNALTAQGQCFILNNTVIQKTVTCSGGTFTPAGRFWGLNLIRCEGTIIHENHFSLGTKHIYGDTGYFKDVKIINNIFENCWTAIEIAGGAGVTLDNFEVAGNTFNINATCDWGVGCWGSAIDVQFTEDAGTPAWENFYVKNNVVKIIGNLTENFRFLRWRNINGVMVSDNITGTGAGLTELDLNGNGIVGDESVLLNNYDTEGVVWTTDSSVWPNPS